MGDAFTGFEAVPAADQASRSRTGHGGKASNGVVVLDGNGSVGVRRANTTDVLPPIRSLVIAGLLR